MPATPQPPPGPGLLWTALVQRVAAGDPDAIQALYASLAGLKGYFCKHIGAEDAEDMFHDLIIVLINQIQKGSLEDPERLTGYVRAIAERQIAAQTRLRMRSRSACSVDAMSSRPIKPQTPKRHWRERNCGPSHSEFSKCYRSSSGRC